MIRRMRSDLPSGTVTFLFTDVEGSTRLLEELGADAYGGVLARHHGVCREAWAAHGGVEVDTAGDAFFVAFGRASGALSAAMAAQEGLVALGVRVRMGVHTGEAALTQTGYVGLEVHRAARIAAAAHGGQVVVSASTRELAGDGFPLVDLGEHRFKDLSAPERVFQLGDGTFPPLKSLYRTNLPTPATPFLGREEELASVAGLLEEPGVRLVSLVGPGGTGKTRLALQAAAEVSDVFPDGVFWAPLAPLRDSALLLPAVASALSVSEGKDSSPVEDLSRALAGRRLLVFVDNVEHLLPDAADALEGFVAACPTVTTVVTTRERLRLPAERVYAVPPMTERDGEALFVARAAAAGVELQPSEELRELCSRLDHLPLALELAAARTVVFSPAQLLDRLAQRLDLLKAGRGVDARQKTLRATIAWSHELLDEHEQQLFRRLSAFAGACDYDAAEQVAGAGPDTLQSLLDKSLLRRRDDTGAPRYWMLETLREYAAEQLRAVGESDELERRHLEHFASVARDCFDDTLAGDHDYDRLLQERENLRLALEHALSTNPELALETALALSVVWRQRGDYREGREKLAAALAKAPDAPTALRARALEDLASLAMSQSDFDTADSLASEALALFRTVQDDRGEAWSFIVLGTSAFYRGDYRRCRRLAEVALDASRNVGDELLPNKAKGLLAIAATAEGDITTAVTLLRGIVASLRRSEAARRHLAIELNNLGVAEEAAGEPERARQAYEESIALSRKEEHNGLLAVALASLGHLEQATAPGIALDRYEESLRLSRELEDPRLVAYCLLGGAAILAIRGDHAHAASLLAAAAAIRTQTGIALTPHEQDEADAVQQHCREALTPDAFERAWDEGTDLDANAADWALQIWSRLK
jgi:predicted ATPase/class 3 adenylate cyclase